MRVVVCVLLMACGGDEPSEQPKVLANDAPRPTIRVAPDASVDSGSAAPVAKPVDKPVAKPITRTEIVEVKRDGDGWAFKVQFPRSSANTRRYCDRKYLDIERFDGGRWVDAQVNPKGARRCSSGPDGMVVLVQETTTLTWNGKTLRGRAARGKYKATVDGASAEFEID